MIMAFQGVGEIRVVKEVARGQGIVIPNLFLIGAHEGILLRYILTITNTKTQDVCNRYCATSVGNVR